ncbi:hypothetical protein BC826DRAFT_603769 [Russula brevipes]|nr:hypothetical protein BC826DRAFT_603769 [Russula brevipes]
MLMDASPPPFLPPFSHWPHRHACHSRYPVYPWCPPHRIGYRKALQGLVAFLSVLDTVQTILCLYSVYWYLILNFGNVETLDVATWSMNIQVFINCVIDYSVQLSVIFPIHLLVSCPDAEADFTRDGCIL